MSYKPCENPHCKSYGRPHPNCRCHGGLAAGGEVTSCAGAHESACEYFADGGMAGFIPDDQFEAAQPPGFIPDNQFESADDHYGTTGQQIGAAVEGFAQGAAGPLATFVETELLGIPKEDIVGRQRAHPITHGVYEAAGLAGSMLIGTGEAALAAKGAEAAAHALQMGNLGSKIVRGAVNNGVIQAGDEVSKWMLGQGDPEEPVAAALSNIGIAGLVGGALGGAGGIAASGSKAALEGLADAKFGKQAQSFLQGIGSAMQGVESEVPAGLSKTDFNKGAKFFNAILNHGGSGGALIEGYRGFQEDGVLGGLKGAGLGYLEGLLFKKGVGGVSKALAPAVLKILSSDALTGALQAIDHAAEIAKGYKGLTRAVDALFDVGAKGSQQILNTEFSEKEREKLDNYIKDGGVDEQIQQQIYENQAPVQAPRVPNGVEIHYPEQNMAMNIAKGRISNYLRSLRPQPLQAKLAFDPLPDTRQQQKSYDTASALALRPMKIFEEIKNGTLQMEQVQHFNAMYPEVYNLMRKRITEGITKAQIDGKVPPRDIRQGLSLFMGTALSSEFQQVSIQSAQSVFSNKQSSQPQPAAPKKSGNTSKLSKSDESFLTGGQALQRRRQKI